MALRFQCGIQNSRLLVEVGDIIIVVESLPDWYWLTYTTGHIGIIIKKRANIIGTIDPICEVFFVHNEEVHPVPERFIKLLSEINESR